MPSSAAPSPGSSEAMRERASSVSSSVICGARRTYSQRAPHRALREAFERLQAEGLALDTLSMGMSADLEAAVAEGATSVRVGSAIFGERG